MNRIPEISDEKLKKLCKRIKPIVRFKGTAFYIRKVDPREIAFTWDPKKKFFFGRAKGLKTVTDITTYHTWSYYGFFKPSIAEVLAQIPESLIDEVCAFEIVICPKTAVDLNKHIAVVNEGYHVATTRLYTKKS